MINVLSVVSELNFGGGENRIFNLARAIDPNRFRLSVATLYAEDHARPERCTSMRRQFADAGVEVIDLGLAHPSRVRAKGALKLASTGRTLIAAISRLRALIRARQIDLVDAHLETALYTGVPAAAAAGVPAVVTLYSVLDLWKLHDGQTYRRAVFPHLRRELLRRCQAILTDSRTGADELGRFIGAAAPPVHVSPNGVRLAAPARSREVVLGALGIPADTRATIIGQVAGLVPFKGQATLLEAGRRIVEQGHEVYVLCIGDERGGPDYPRALREQAERLGIAGRVRIRSWPGDIAEVWSVIDLHAHPSTMDSLPNAIIEGMSQGKPAVVTPVGGIPDHVDHGRTGLIVPPGDPDALAAALMRLIDDPELARRLGAAARERYLERFTPEVTTREIERCFEVLVDAHRRRRGGRR